MVNTTKDSGVTQDRDADSRMHRFFRRDWEEENKQEWLELLGDVTSW